MLKLIKFCLSALVIIYSMTSGLVLAEALGESKNAPLYQSDVFYYGPKDSGYFCWFNRDNTGKVINKECGTPNTECQLSTGATEYCNGYAYARHNAGEVWNGPKLEQLYRIGLPKKMTKLCVAAPLNGNNTSLFATGGKNCDTIKWPTTYTVDPTNFPPTTVIKEGTMLQANINGAMVTCVVGQSCDAVYDTATQKYVGLTYRVDTSLAVGTPLNYNGTACKHLVNCQKMMAGGIVWPLGVNDLATLNAFNSAVLPTPTPTPTPTLSWAKATGSLPAAAIEIGTDGGGVRTYVCRAPVTNGLITGKLAWGNTCFYAFFGKEYSITQGYEVLFFNTFDSNLKWRPWNGGTDWDVGRGGNRKALVGGSYDNKPIVPCRANFKGGMVGGHFFGGTCFLPYAGVENPVTTFELLGY